MDEELHNRWALKIHWVERARLLQDQAALAAAFAEQPTAAALAQATAPAGRAAQAVAAGSSQASGLIVSRSTPAAPAAPVLASVQQLDEQVETRGLCEGALRRLRADCARQCRQRPEIWRVLAQRLSVMGACDRTCSLLGRWAVIALRATVDYELGLRWYSSPAARPQ
jgi:hypothetical protein